MYAKNLENHTTNRPKTTLTAPQSIPKMRYRGSSAKQKWEIMITFKTTCSEMAIENEEIVQSEEPLLTYKISFCEELKVHIE
jgi:hypothetical protein